MRGPFERESVRRRAQVAERQGRHLRKLQGQAVEVVSAFRALSLRRRLVVAWMVVCGVRATSRRADGRFALFAGAAAMVVAGLAGWQAGRLVAALAALWR